MVARMRIETAKRDGWLIEVGLADERIVGLLTPELDRGEAEAITLALEMRPATMILLDERDALDAALRLGLTLTGLLGVLMRAKRGRQIHSLRVEVDALRNEAGSSSPSTWKRGSCVGPGSRAF